MKNTSNCKVLKEFIASTHDANKKKYVINTKQNIVQGNFRLGYGNYLGLYVPTVKQTFPVVLAFFQLS